MRPERRRWKLAIGDRRYEAAGAYLTGLTLCWLAAHRWIRSLLLGGKRLTVLVLWDPKGAAAADIGDADLDAIRQLVGVSSPGEARADDASPASSTWESDGRGESGAGTTQGGTDERYSGSARDRRERRC